MIDLAAAPVFGPAVPDIEISNMRDRIQTALTANPTSANAKEYKEYIDAADQELSTRRTKRLIPWLIGGALVFFLFIRKK